MGSQWVQLPALTSIFVLLWSGLATAGLDTSAPRTTWNVALICSLLCRTWEAHLQVFPLGNPTVPISCCAGAWTITYGDLAPTVDQRYNHSYYYQVPCGSLCALALQACLVAARLTSILRGTQCKLAAATHHPPGLSRSATSLDSLYSAQLCFGEPAVMHLRLPADTRGSTRGHCPVPLLRTFRVQLLSPLPRLPRVPRPARGDEPCAAGAEPWLCR
jgi:hypothetical protein